MKETCKFNKKWINYSGIIIIKKINDYTECSGKQKLYAEEYFEFYQMDPFVNVFPTEKTKTSYSFSCVPLIAIRTLKIITLHFCRSQWPAEIITTLILKDINYCTLLPEWLYWM
jgi:hypothetical protein